MNSMDLLIQIATQGLGYTLFVLAVFVIIYQNRKLEGKDKELSVLHEKLLSESNLYTASFTAVAKEMVAANRDSVNATAILQKSVDTITQILQNLANNK
jgi:hypothetical protein